MIIEFEDWFFDWFCFFDCFENRLLLCKFDFLSLLIRRLPFGKSDSCLLIIFKIQAYRLIWADTVYRDYLWELA